MTLYFGSGSDSIELDGSEERVLDFGGRDSYVVRSELSGDLTIVDNQASDIYLPAGLVVSQARFASDGVQFTINGSQLTFLGKPGSFTFFFGGEQGTARDFAQTAAAFGAEVPALGEAPRIGTNTGLIEANGDIQVIDILTVNAANTIPIDASGKDLYFDFDPGNYSYVIDGFGAGDYLAFPAGNDPSLVNEDFSDGEVQLTWVGEDADGPVNIRLTGLATSDDAQLLQLSDFTALFGATAIV